MEKHNIQKTIEEGDETMEMTVNNFQPLDVNFILAHGKTISSQEALADVVPVDWSEDVLNGMYQNKTIIKSSKKS